MRHALRSRRRLGHPACLASLAVVFATGCGNGRLGSDGDNQIQRSSLATPVDYRLDDPECQGTAGVAAIGAQPIHTWNGETGVEEVHPFDINGMTSVSSSQIRGTLYGYHQQTPKTCTLDAAGNAACEEGDSVVKRSEQDLKLCKPSGTYGRDSVEGVTLASIANLDAARSIYSSLAGATLIDKALLLVLPNYETTVDYKNPTTGEASYRAYSDTDNAAFAAVKSDTGSDLLVYVVFPRSQELSQDPEWKEVRLWEVPWVMAHEFSHQIFFSHYSNYYADNGQARALAAPHDLGGLAADSLGVWKRPGQYRFPGHPSVGEGLSLAGHIRDADVSEALTAVNEGFADLFAAQMLDGRTDQTRNLPCFVKSRDILSSAFADGSAKILTEEARTTFFSSTAVDVSGTCPTDFQDVHHIGAIFAHGLNEILMASLAPGAGIEERAERVLAWLNAFDDERNASSLESAEDTWVLAVKAALKTAQGEAETLLASQCQTAKTIFPVYSARLFNDEGATDGFTCL